jgi:hypothetical protein
MSPLDMMQQQQQQGTQVCMVGSVTAHTHQQQRIFSSRTMSPLDVTQQQQQQQQGVC